MKKNILLLAFTIYIGYIQASHIVGGELYYTWMSGDSFKVTFIEYRNCGCSVNNSCAEYDEPLYIQVFDNNGGHLNSFSIVQSPRDTLPIIDSLLCTASPQPYCIEVAIFEGIAVLPYRPGGYQLVYQRCCRNSDIQSIPIGTGASYIALLSDSALIQHDRSPRFGLINPQIFVVGRGVHYDLSALDPDGDSIVYSMATPYDGASPNCPDPSPNSAGSPGCPTEASAPFLPIPYYPPYSAQNPTNNPSDSNNLHIDSLTGILLGTPNQSGIFLMGIAAEEYRNGVSIGKTILDYQFIVEGCSARYTSVEPLTAEPKTIIYASGKDVYVCMENSDNPNAEITYYDLLGRMIDHSQSRTSSHKRTFESVSSNYLIVKVQQQNGITTYKEVFIQ